MRSLPVVLIGALIPIVSFVISIFWPNDVAAQLQPSGPIVITGQSNKTYENLRITSSTSGCVRISNSSNITIRQSDIGPCNGNAIEIFNSTNITIVDSYIHSEKRPSACCDTGDGIFSSGVTGLHIQGNIIAFNEANIEVGNTHDVQVIGNFLLNPLGPFPRGENFQSWNNSSNIRVSNNYALASKDSTRYPYLEDQSDSINFGFTNGIIAENNYIRGGNFAFGCGLITDEDASNAQFINNTLVDTGPCGIGISDGVNQVVRGNRVLNRTSIPGAGNTAIYVWLYYSGSCGPTEVSNNIATQIRADGYQSGFWDGGGCGPVTGSGNIWNEQARQLLEPIDVKYPPPLVPPLPFSCVIDTPYTTQTSRPRCGSNTADTLSPTASLSSASNITVPGVTSYSISVRYQDNVAIKVSSLGSGDIIVSAPGFSQTATLSGVDINSDGTPRVATYTIVPPGGSWDAADNATYSVLLQAGQVLDTSSNSAAAAGLGSFQVGIAATDSDGDGVPDARDNCPSVSNASQTNTDGDSQGDVCDTDDDNDGVTDGSDCSPLNAGFYRDQAYADPDNDGVRNTSSASTVSCYGATAPAGYTANTNGPDNCPSASNASQTNTDGDSQGDACDSDDDNDGAADSSDCASLDSTKWRNQAFADSDGDGVRNSTTASTVSCFGATAPGGYTTNAVGFDNCPNVANPSQSDSDSDGTGDACDTNDDRDGDGVVDSIDNCPSTPNSSQANTDGDSQGDACDSDDDNDGTADSSDCASLDSTKWRNQAYPDSDGDGVAESTEPQFASCYGAAAPAGFVASRPAAPDNCPAVSNPKQEDTDGDGAGDACDPEKPRPKGRARAVLDFDGDGVTDLALRSADTDISYYGVALSTGGTKEFAFGNTREIPVSGEFTADPLWDVASVREQEGGLWWRVRDTFDGAESEFLFGLSGDQVLSGCDFTGEGGTDAAVIRSGAIIYRHSETKAVISTNIRFGAGVNPASITCRDLTGDGRDELIILESKLSRRIRSYTASSAYLSAYRITGERLFMRQAINPLGILTLDANGDGITDAGYVQEYRGAVVLVQEVRIGSRTRKLRLTLGFIPSAATPGTFVSAAGQLVDGQLMLSNGSLYVLNSADRTPLRIGQLPQGDRLVLGISVSE